MSIPSPFVHQIGVLLVVSVLINVGFYLLRAGDCMESVDTVQKTLLADFPPLRIIDDEGPVLSSVTYVLPQVDCDRVGSVLKKGRLSPWEVNELRRNVTLADPECFDRHFRYFAEAFIPRIHMRQYNLHIPKTGGTSLCRLVTDNGLKAPPKLCRHQNYCPFWCGFCKTLQPLSCREVRDSDYSFIGNERWLDHDDSLFCTDFAHSISIREPVARAISNVQMWLSKSCSGKNNFTDSERAERLQIVQSNYMTWSLTAGSSDYPEGFKPTLGHVNMARRMLSRFDFIINVEASECFDDTLGFMGFHKTEIEHHRVAAANYSLSYNRENYSTLNALDTMVYEFAQDLIRIDCEFFRRLKEAFDIPKAPYRSPISPLTKTKPTKGMSMRQRVFESRQRTMVNPNP